MGKATKFLKKIGKGTIRTGKWGMQTYQAYKAEEQRRIEKAILKERAKIELESRRAELEELKKKRRERWSLI
jgi:hypothetical protein